MHIAFMNQVWLLYQFYIFAQLDLGWPLTLVCNLPPYWQSNSCCIFDPNLVATGLFKGDSNNWPKWNTHIMYNEGTHHTNILLLGHSQVNQRSEEKLIRIKLIVRVKGQIGVMRGQWWEQANSKQLFLPYHYPYHSMELPSSFSNSS